MSKSSIAWARDPMGLLLTATLGLMLGTLAGCATMAVLVVVAGHDNMLVFYSLIAAGVLCGLLFHTAPLVAAYARSAVGRK